MKQTKKILASVVTAGMIFGMLPTLAFADGGYYVDSSYISLAPGQTATITISADQAAGRVDLSASGGVSVNSGSEFLDNGSTTITVTADQVGTGYITVNPTDISTYDGEEINYSYTIQVDVIDPNAAAVGGAADNVAAQVAADNTQDNNNNNNNNDNNNDNNNNNTQNDQQETTTDEAETAAAENTVVLTDGTKDYEDLSEEERLYTTVDDQELYIIQYPLWANDNGDTVWNDEITNLDRLNGFELKNISYKGVSVDTFVYEDTLQLFVLKNLETDTCGYYTLEDGVGFSPLSYVTANGRQYIVVDFPEDFVIPEGYQMVEMTLGGNKVQALKKIDDNVKTTAPVETEPATEAETQDLAGNDAAVSFGKLVVDQRTTVMLKGYETVVSPGLASEDPTNDIYYIYCLVDGETQLYSYDSGEGTLQRAAILVYNEIPTEPQTVIVYETNPDASVVGNTSFISGIGWNGMQIQMKVLLIAFAVAIILIIILIIVAAVLKGKNRKQNKKHNNRKTNNRSNKGSNSNEDDQDEEGAFFSYVKTEDDLGLDDLDMF